MKIKPGIIAALILCCTMLAACEQPSPAAAETAETVKPADTEAAAQTVESEDMFTSRDMTSSYDESNCVRIKLEGNSAVADSDGVQISGATVTISREGLYVLSGTLDEGMVIVDTPREAKLQLVLDGARINSPSSAAIYVRQAEKVFVTLADGSENSLSNGGGFTAIDENNIDAVLWSKDDLSINGGGKLALTSPDGHGIVCKDDLVIYGGEIDISASGHGIEANDSVRFGTGKLNISAGKDGIHAENSDDAQLGFVYVSGGEIEISCGDDGIHAGAELTVCGGCINIAESYEGLEALTVYIQGGDISILAQDDGINAAGGEAAGKLEGGIGAGFPGHGGMGGPGGAPGMGGGHGGGPGTAMGSSEGEINISGGKIYIEAYGDGFDANGSISISGGDTVVCGPTRGDTATLDYDVSATISGGNFIGTGAYGMAQSFSSSEQGLLAVSTGNRSAGTGLRLEDENGELILSHTPELDYAVVIISSPHIISGETYKLYVGSDSAEFQAK